MRSFTGMDYRNGYIYIYKIFITYKISNKVYEISYITYKISDIFYIRYLNWRNNKISNILYKIS